MSPNSGQQNNTIGAFLAVAAAVLLAITNVTAPGLYALGTNPPSILVMRAFVTVASLGLLLAVAGRLRLFPVRDELYCIVSGLLFSLVGFGLFEALAISPVSTVVLVLYVFPLLTAILESFVDRRVPDVRTLFLMLLALAGLWLALDVGARSINYLGVGLALMAAVGVACTLVWNSRMLHHVAPEHITLRMFCVNSIIFLVYSIYLGNFQMPKGENWLLLLILIMVCFALAFPAFFRAVQMTGPIRTSMIMNMEPVTSIVLSVIVLNEIIGTWQMIGAAMVILAVLISQLLERMQKN